VVTSFISEAGLTGLSACQASRGRAASTSCTHATIASRGMPPRASAASTVRGRLRVSVVLTPIAVDVAVAAGTAGAARARSSADARAAGQATARRRGAAEAMDRDRMRR
jgi:hypothetical protein